VLVVLFLANFFGGTALSEPEVVYKIQKPVKASPQEKPEAAAAKAEAQAGKPEAAQPGKPQAAVQKPQVTAVKPEAAAEKAEPQAGKPAPEAGRPAADDKPVPVYDPTGKTDPFKSFIAEEEAVDDKQKKEPKTYLETLELSQLDLIAIVETSEGNWAMVRDSKGIGYPIRKGTAIGTRAGVVQEIKSSEIIIREQHRDIRGKTEVKYVKKELLAPK